MFIWKIFYINPYFLQRSALKWMYFLIPVFHITRISEACWYCAEHRWNKSEPLITSPLPCEPLRKVWVNILKKDSRWFMVVIDYYSKYIELSHSTQLNIRTVILRLEVIFHFVGVIWRQKYSKVPLLSYSSGNTEFLTSLDANDRISSFPFVLIWKEILCPTEKRLFFFVKSHIFRKIWIFLAKYLFFPCKLMYFSRKRPMAVITCGRTTELCLWNNL